MNIMDVSERGTGVFIDLKSLTFANLESVTWSRNPEMSLRSFKSAMAPIKILLTSRALAQVVVYTYALAQGSPAGQAGVTTYINNFRLSVDYDTPPMVKVICLRSA